MSRFLDARGRIFGKVNIVDLIVLCVIVAVVVFAVVRTTGGSSETIPLEVTYTVEEVRRATVDALVGAVQAKAVVRDDAGTNLGTVVSVTPSPTKEEFVADGELKAADSQVFSDVKIVVRGEGRLANSTLRVGSVFMRVGKKITLVGSGFEVQSVIMQVVRLSGPGAVK
jgi:hypothetical protein